MRKINHIILTSISFLLSACASHVVVKSNTAANIDYEPKSILVYEAMGDRLQKDEAESFKEAFQNRLNGCGIRSAYMIKKLGDPTLALDGKNEQLQVGGPDFVNLNPDSILNIVEQSYVSNGGKVVSEEFLIRLTELKTKKAVWIGSISLTSGFYPKNTPADYMAIKLLNTLIENGVIHGCPTIAEG